MHHKIALSQYKRSPNNQSTMHSTTLKKKELINQNQKQKIITKKTELYVIKLNITT
ncbi:hypothetical protein SeKA_A3975 [Salmonella enterica subsp. enterica serovar Kentucky str. CVM29188]|nr:hypothetical protein SeKA_A3975 [Salmonella enterica subsp. enterica serovar Kentucky str. CVM29188]EDZ21129.1 hypothetical protein SeKB_A4513 [Salmonella enterica subsp. enterica serovar Kentucky str. CDC 191]